MKNTNNNPVDYDSLSNNQIEENLRRIIRENKSVEEIENAIKNELNYLGTPAVSQSEPNQVGQTMTMIMVFNKEGETIFV
jgi:glutaredoxin-related protein